MKNFKLTNKGLSLLTAGMLMATPIGGLAEGTTEVTNDTTTKQTTIMNSEVPSERALNELIAGAENKNSSGFKLETQDEEKTALLTVDAYVEGVGNAYNYLKKFIKYDHLQKDLQCLYYLVNRSYMDEETEEALIKQGVVYKTDPKNGEYKTFMSATNLIGNINDYNQSSIRNMYKSYKKTKNVKKMNSTKLIDMSKLCFDEHDAKIVHSMFANWYNAYKNNRFPNKYFTEVFKELTTLNSEEGRNNAHSLSVGARWVAQVEIGSDVRQMLRDDMTEDFKRKQLDKYFDKAKLNQAQWILRKDVSLDLNCLKNELEEEVFYFGQLEYWCNTTVNNDILKSFDKNDCNTKTK